MEDFQKLIDVLIKTVGAIIVIGGPVSLIAWAALKTFADRWLSTQFDKELEEFKTKQQGELENIRYRINSVFDRAVRLHQIEFEVLPNLWAKMNDAYHETVAYTAWMRAIPDLDKAKEPQLESFLNSTPLADWQKGELRQSKDKVKYYSDAMHFHETKRAQDFYREFHLFRIKKGVFLTPETEDIFKKVDDLIWGAISERDTKERMLGQMPEGSRHTD